MSGKDQIPDHLQQDNGKGKEGDVPDGNKAQLNKDLLYVDEPERMFHQRRREAAELALREAVEAEELYQRKLLEQQGGEQYYAPVNNQGQRARVDQYQYAQINNPRYAPGNNPPPPPMQQGYARQQPRQQHYREQPPMRNYSIPTVENQTWCIDTDADLEGFELRTNVVHLLPKFAGLPGEVATQHLKEYEGVCKSWKPYSAPPDRYRLAMFPYSLTDVAKSWFLSLPSGSIRTWEQMQRSFLEKFYPVGKANQIRRELSTIKQGPNESTYEYLERFNGLEQGCCNLGLPEYLVVDYLLEGLRPLERKMLDAAAGGSVMNLAPGEVRELLKESAESARFTETTARRENTGRMRNVSQVETGTSQMLKK